MSDRVIVRPCWFCRGRITVGGAAPCDTCEGHGRLRITYGTDAAGELTQTVEPQPDSPLPLTPALTKIQKIRDARRSQRERLLPMTPTLLQVQKIKAARKATKESA